MLLGVVMRMYVYQLGLKGISSWQKASEFEGLALRGPPLSLKNGHCWSSIINPQLLCYQVDQGKQKWILSAQVR